MQKEDIKYLTRTGKVERKITVPKNQSAATGQSLAALHEAIKAAGRKDYIRVVVVPVAE